MRKISSSGLRFGVVGLGFGGRVILPGLALLADQGISVTRTSSRSELPGLEIAARFGAKHTTEWRDLVASPDVDVVCIASPPASHCEIALAALERGKPVICEKPLSVTLSDAEEMTRAANRLGVPTLVDFEFRTLRTFQAAHAALRSGRIGRIRTVSVSWRLPTRLGARLAPSWKDDAGRGGGVLLGFGPHVFDYVEWFAGRLSEVTGELATAVPGQARSDDGLTLAGRTVDGTLVEISLSTAAVDDHGHVVLIHGERGGLVLANPDTSDFMRGFTLEPLGPGEQTQPSVGEPFVGAPTEDGRIRPFARLVAEFVQRLRGGAGAATVPDFAAGERAQQIATAVAESARRGHTVAV